MPNIVERTVSALRAFRAPGMVRSAPNLNPSFFSGGYMQQIGGANGAEVTDAYSQSDVVYACINAISKAVSAVPLRAVASDRKTAIDNSPWQTLFDNPNPILTRFQTWNAIICYLYTRRGCKALLIGAMGPRQQNEIPIELWPMPGDVFKPIDENGNTVQDATKRPTRWRIEIGNYRRDVEAHQVLDLKFFDPSSPLFGFLPLNPARTAINSGYAMSVWNASFFVNHCDPGGWMTVPGNAPTPAQQRQLEESFRDQHQGPQKRGKTLFLYNGATYSTNPRTQRDMEFIEGKRLAREEVCMVFGVPEAVIGLTKDTTFANMRDSMRIFYDNTATPLMKDFEDALYSQMMKSATADQWANFDTSQIPAYQADFTERLSQANSLAMLGYSLDQINERLGLGMPAAPPPILPKSDPLLAILSAPDAPVVAPQPSGLEAIFKSGHAPGKRSGALQISDRKAYIDEYCRAVPDRWTLKMRGEMLRYLNALSTAQLARFKNWMKANKLTETSVKDLDPSDLDAILFQRERWDKAIEAAARESLNSTIKGGLEAAGKETGSVSIAMSDPRVNELFGSTIAELVKVNVTTQKRIRAHLLAADAQGETIQEKQMRLVQVFQGNPARALLIARTENGMASSGARFIQTIDAGIETHEWVNAGSGAIREAHEDQPIGVGGEKVKLGERFSNGMKHPHEIGASPSQNCNCRCEALAVL